MTEAPVRLLVVEDNAADRRLVREMLREVPGRIDLSEAGRLEEALEQLRRDRPDVALLDLGLPDSNGLATLDAVRRTAPSVPIIVMTGLNDEEIGMRAVSTGAQDYLIKGEIGGAGLVRSIRYAVARHRSEQQLRAEKAFTEAILDSVPGAICLLDETSHIVRWNRQFEVMTGYSAEEIAERIATDYYDAQDHGSINEAIGRVIAEGRAELEVNIRTKAGETVPLFVSGTRLTLDGRQYLTAVGLDISRRKRAEDELRRSEVRFRAILENASDAIALVDASGTVLYQTPGIERITGFGTDEFVGRSIFAHIHPDDRLRVEEAFRHALDHPGEIIETEARHRARDGSWRLLQSVGKRFESPVGSAAGVIVSRDVTDRRALEDQLRQAQKMEAVGRLAGGVAHDFNNLLTAIVGFTELLLASMPEDAPGREDVVEIRSAADRAAVLTRQLLAFSRRQAVEPQLVDLNAILEGLQRMLRRVLREDIDFSLDLDRGIGRVFADPGQLEQVIINLAVNARDAIADRGRLTVSTRRVIATEPFSVGDAGLAAGEYACLLVSDTGIGISDDVREHMFEPFFTTKPEGKGTGLGLAMVYGIVKQAGGAIGVDSAPGRGSTFTMYLPVTPSTR